MATLRQYQDDPAPDEAPDDAAPDQGGGDRDHASVDPNDPSHMVGWIDPRLPAKVRVFLRACKVMVMSDAGEQAIKKAATASDYTKGLAYFIAKTIEQAQNKLGPLNDKEHDQVAFFLAGWIVSAMQGWGMPGLDDAGARQDLIGRILQQLDQLSGNGQQGAQNAQGGPPAPGVPDAGAEAAPPAGAPADEEGFE